MESLSRLPILITAGSIEGSRSSRRVERVDPVSMDAASFSLATRHQGGLVGAEGITLGHATGHSRLNAVEKEVQCGPVDP